MPSRKKPITVRSVTSSDVQVYPSIQETAKALFVTESNVSHAVKHNRLVLGAYRLSMCNSLIENNKG